MSKDEIMEIQRIADSKEQGALGKDGQWHTDNSRPVTRPPPALTHPSQEPQPDRDHSAFGHARPRGLIDLSGIYPPSETD